MDYEKKYKEALERAKDYYKANQKIGESDENEVLSDIFPELKECEDERIKFQKEQQCHIDDAIYDELIAWLKKQGQSIFEQCKQDGDRIVENSDGTHFNISQLERVAKVEQKFKVGDWITNGHCIYQITFIDSRYWYSETGVLGDVESIDKKFHLWTIADAKDGDVLDAYGTPFIYIKHDKDYVYFYCGVNLAGEFIEANGIDIWSNNNKVYPATKEQRDLLFAKMKEAGYEWDADNKKLLPLKTEPIEVKENIEDFDTELNALLKKYKHLYKVDIIECLEFYIDEMRKIMEKQQ